MWYYIAAVIGAAIGFGTCALLEINGENKKIQRWQAALQDLYDEQNGPPLLRDELSWQVAMDKAGKLLESDQ